MKRLIPTVLAIVLALGIVRADRRPVPTNLFQLKLQSFPTTLTNLSTLGSNFPPLGSDVYICRLDVGIAPNSGTVNLTIQTNEATPIKFWDAVPITATSATQGTAYNGIIAAGSPDACVYFPKGVALQASGSGVTITALSGRY
jgi:hypothetical protein